MATGLLIGQPGSGKTSYAAEHEMLPYFSATPNDWDPKWKPETGQPGEGIIVTNVPVVRERWVEEFGEQAVSERLIVLPQQTTGADGATRFTFSALEDFAPYLELRDKHGRGPKFVIDEAHNCIPKGLRFGVDKNTGQRLDTFPNQLLRMFTEQRHLLISFVLITQDPFSMAPDILKQVHSSVFIENAATKGSDKCYTSKVWNKPPPRNYQDVKFKDCDDGHPKPVRYNPRSQAFFVSNSRNKAGNVGRKLEGKYRHSRTIFQRPIFFLMIGSLVVMFVSAFVLKSRLEHPNQLAGKNAKAKPVQEGPKKPNPMDTSPASRTNSGDPGSTVIRDLGTVEEVASAKEFQLKEAAFTVTLEHPYAVILPRVAGSAPGPILRWTMPGVAQAYHGQLSEYASYYGYEVTPVECGWKMSRSDSVRMVYDNGCMGRIQYSERSTEGTDAGRSPGIVERTVGATAARVSGGIGS